VPIACVIGWPIKHSRSPAIHRFWLNEFRIVGDYVVQPVEPDKVTAFFKNFPSGSYVGCNVTVPHKEIAFRSVDEIEAAGREIGAVNTIWRDGARLVATSTDGVGFLANLDAGAPGWSDSPGPAVVLGAGGAARAVVWALLRRGFAPVHVVNRSRDRAEALAARFGERVRAADWVEVAALFGEARVLVNSTSLGMEGQPALDLDLAALRADCLVTDIVYVPLETPLLAAARARRLRTVDGLGMLLHQAAPGFEHWFGRKPEVTPALRQAVLHDMGLSGDPSGGSAGSKA
jgi:shikimate dehydrogenase